MTEWIKTETRLPPQGSTCLIFADNSIETAWLCIDDPRWQIERTGPQDELVYFTLDQVEYWMPLPDPPKEKP